MKNERDKCKTGEMNSKTHRLRSPFRFPHKRASCIVRARIQQNLRAIIDADLEHVFRAVGPLAAGLIFLVLGDVEAAPAGGLTVFLVSHAQSSRRAFHNSRINDWLSDCGCR